MLLGKDRKIPAYASPADRHPRQQDMSIPLDIIHQDAGVMVLNKPSGISLLADRSGAPCLWDQFPDLLGGKPYLVHRLDKPTSGALILARTAESQRRLTRAFQRREIRKYYLAWVQGMPPVAGTIDLPLRKGRKSRFRVAGGRAEIERIGSLWRLRGASDDAVPAAPDGHASQTRFRTLRRRGAKSLVLLQPLTGRTHQLRVHMAWIGYPIMGDLLYGNPTAPAQQAPRLQLHCHRLVVPGLPGLTADRRRDWLND